MECVLDEGLTGCYGSWLMYGSYGTILVVCLIWAAVAAVAFLLTSAAVGIVHSMSTKPGRRLPHIVAACFWFSGPVITVLLATGMRIVGFLEAEPWVLPVTVAVAILTVLGWWAWRSGWIPGRRRTSPVDAHLAEQPRPVDPATVFYPVPDPTRQPIADDYWSRPGAEPQWDGRR